MHVVCLWTDKKGDNTKRLLTALRARQRATFLQSCEVSRATRAMTRDESLCVADRARGGGSPAGGLEQSSKPWLQWNTVTIDVLAPC